MKPASLEAGTFKALRSRILSSKKSRHHHRLHAVLLVARGLSCRQAALLLGDSPRTVEYWVNSYKKKDVRGLREKSSPGRPPRLTARRFSLLRAAVASGAWSGRSVAAFVAGRWGVALGLRQAQRVLALAREMNMRNDK